MAVSDANTSNGECTSFKKYIAVLKDPAKRTKESLLDTLKKSRIRFSDQANKLKPEEQNTTLLLKKLDKITAQLDILKDLQEDDVIKFALKTEQNLMAVAANPRTPKLERMMARVASHKPLSTHLAKIKRKREDSDSESEGETPESTSTKLDKMSLNNQVVKMRKDVRRAKVHIIHKLTKNVARFRNSKASGKFKEKLERKVERLVKKIKYIKELDVDEASRFALTTTQDLSKISTDVKIPMKTQALATVALHKFVAAPVADFKSSFPDWQKTVPAILKKKKKKRKPLIETKENLKIPNKKSNIDTNSTSDEESKSAPDEDVVDSDGMEEGNDGQDCDSVQMEGENDGEDVDSVQMEGKSYDEDQHGTESSDEGEDDFFTRVSSDNENSDSSHKVSKIKSKVEEDRSEKFGLKRNKTLSKQSFVLTNEAEPSKNPTASNKMKTTKRGSKIDQGERKRLNALVKQSVDVIKKEGSSSFDKSEKSIVPSNSDSETNEKKSKKVDAASNIKDSKSSFNASLNKIKKLKTPENIKKDSKKKEKKPASNKIIKKLDLDQVRPKVVDPFFVTSTNEEYVTNQAPALEENSNSDWQGKNEDPYSRKTKRFSSFDKIKQTNWKDDWRQNKFKNRESKPYDKPFTNSFEKVPNKKSDTLLIQLGNRKDRRKSLQQAYQSEKVEKLHPSWEAKKKISSLATFQGKKITFD